MGHSNEADHIFCHFSGKLTRTQRKAYKLLKDLSKGILAGPAGCGKKVLALYRISQAGGRALIIVRDRSRLREWKETIVSFLQNYGEVRGSVDKGIVRFGSTITIIVDGCLAENAALIPLDIDLAVVDECNQSDLRILLCVLIALSPRSVLGVTRYLHRPDGLNKEMKTHIGPPVCHIEATEQNWRLKLGGVLKTRQTDFCFKARDDSQGMSNILYADEQRNRLILADILHEADYCRVLVVSTSALQLKALETKLIDAGQPPVGILLETMPDDEEVRLLEVFRKNKEGVVLAALQAFDRRNILIDCKAMVIASPCPYDYPLIMACGALKASDDFNPPVIYDYIDMPASLRSLYESRVKRYRRIGISRTISADFVH